MTSLIKTLTKLGDLEVHRYKGEDFYTLKLHVEWSKQNRVCYHAEHEDFQEALDILAKKAWTDIRDLFMVTSSHADKYRKLTDDFKAELKLAGRWNKLMHPEYDGPETCSKCYGELIHELGKPDELYCPACVSKAPCD